MLYCHYVWYRVYRKETAVSPSRRSWTILWLLFCLIMAALPAGGVSADGPDYGDLGDWVLPWGCGEAYRVSWEPEGHWEYGKARGVAYDFVLPEGTPLYAPLAGNARFMEDTRPLETHFGHYVEITSPTGDWLLRLAHLRDPQAGERWVSQGELIGFSGRSGVTADHLHFELLMWGGEQWVCPELERLERICGMPRSSLFEGAYILRRGCKPELLQERSLRLDPSPVILGQEALLTVPLDNVGGETARIREVQLVLQAPDGESATVDIEGNWWVPAEGQSDLVCPLNLPSPGVWRLIGVTCLGNDLAASWESEMTFTVRAAELSAASLTWPAVDLAMGDALAPTLDLNRGEDWLVAKCTLQGRRPDGGMWRMPLRSVGPDDALAPIAPLIVDQVGAWRAETLWLSRDGRDYALPLADEGVTVHGPQLVVRGLNSYRGSDRLSLFLRVRNVGSMPLDLSALDVWGRCGKGDLSLGGRQTIAFLWPHAPSFVQIDVPLAEGCADWELVEAGYWHRGNYYPLALPQASPAPAHAPALDVVAPREYGLRAQ